MTERERRLEAALRAVEWLERRGPEGALDSSCPACHGIRDGLAADHGHKLGCVVYAALAPRSGEEGA